MPFEIIGKSEDHPNPIAAPILIRSDEQLGPRLTGLVSYQPRADDARQQVETSLVA